jgi:AmmeMemoRadiSam system protein B
MGGFKNRKFKANRQAASTAHITRNHHQNAKIRIVAICQIHPIILVIQPWTPTVFRNNGRQSDYIYYMDCKSKQVEKVEQYRVREPAVADMFYPADPQLLRQTIASYLEGVEPAPRQPKALIAPHAGYVYSGAIAAAAYGALAPYHDVIKRVVLLGPSHRVAFHGIAATGNEIYRTPLGDIPLDTKAAYQLTSAFSFVEYLDAAHESEHSLEVHLPFLQVVIDDFELLPLVVGEADIGEVEAVLEAVWGGRETLIVGSSDLSHFYNDSTANKLDHETSHAIETLDARSLDTHHACGAYPVRGLLETARKHHLRAETLALGNSAKVSGDYSRVVGYGSWLFYEPEQTLQ